jgi:hypothetical protein
MVGSRVATGNTHQRPRKISFGGKIDFFNTIGTVGVAVQVRDFRR